VRSNRESAYGDATIRPRTPGTGVVLELKVINPDDDDSSDVARALASAVKRLRARDYAAQLLADGATAVHQYAVVFDGKRCRVEAIRA
jgi:hypothetical protein